MEKEKYENLRDNIQNSLDSPLGNFAKSVKNKSDTKKVATLLSGYKSETSDIEEQQPSIRDIKKSAIRQAIPALLDKEFIVTPQKPTATTIKTSKKNPLYTNLPVGRVTPVKQNDSVANVIAKLYNLLSKSFEEKKRNDEIEKSFKLERKQEDERRHKELIKLLSGAKVAEKKDKPEKEEKDSFFDKLKEMFGSFIGGLMKGFGWLMKLKPLITGFFEIVGRVGLNIIKTIFTLFGNPLFLVAAAGVATIFALRELLFKVAEITPNMKALSPEEAYNALKGGSPKDIEALGGREYLTDVIKTGKKKAEEALSMPEGEERDKRIRELGGLEKVQKISADTREYEVPLAIDMNKGPERVSPRPTKGGLALKSKQDKWDKDWGKNYDPETGIRKDLIAEEARSDFAKTDPRRMDIPSQATPVPPTPSPLGQAVQGAIRENNNIKLDEQVESSKPVIINNTNNSKSLVGGSSSSTSMDVSIRTDEDILNYTVMRSVKVV